MKFKQDQSFDELYEEIKGVNYKINYICTKLEDIYPQLKGLERNSAEWNKTFMEQIEIRYSEEGLEKMDAEIEKTLLYLKEVS